MHNDSAITVSVVIPVYNARDSLPLLIADLVATLRCYSRSEIIAVNDGSADDSFAVLVNLAKDYPGLVVVDLAKNSGQENAILAGFEHVTCDYVICMDDDLQHDAGDIPKLIETLIGRDLDIVFARFTQKTNGVFRRLGTRMNDWMMNFVVEKPRHIELSSFLALRRYIVTKVGEYEGPFPYLAGQYLCLTKRIGNVDLIQRARRFNQSNYSLRKLVLVWASGLVNFGLAPLRLLLWLGLCLVAVAVALIMVLVVNRLINGAAVPMGWTSLMVVILVLAAVQMFSLGLIGEYLGRVLMTATRYPRYCVRSVYPPARMPGSKQGG